MKCRVILNHPGIAIGGKIIIMEPKDYNPLTLMGITAMILALFAGYWVIKRKAL